MTFGTASGQTFVEGRYAVLRFTSGGERLNGWTVKLNGSSADEAVVSGYRISLRRDATGIWVKVFKDVGTLLIFR